MKNKYGYKILFCLLVSWGYLQSQTQSVLLKKDILVIKTEGVAFLGSGITEDDAKTLAINDAKRNAMELAGTYLESHTEVLNYTLIKDEIITYTGDGWPGLVRQNKLTEWHDLLGRVSQKSNVYDI